MKNWNKNIKIIIISNVVLIFIVIVLIQSRESKQPPLCRCLTEPGTTEWMRNNEEVCDQLISKEIGVNDWKKVNFSKSPILESRWQSLKRSCGR